MGEPCAVVGLEGLIETGAVPELLNHGSIWAEGIVYLPGTNFLRWSDIPNNRIMQYDLSDEVASVYQADVEFTNGRTLDRDGSILQCSHGRRRVERDRDGVVSAVVESWDGVPFNSPNDVVVAPDGSIWFTDPPYGIIFPREGHAGEREYGDHYVFRHDTITGETRAAVLDVEEPNGLAFSPDGSIIYITDSSALTGSDSYPGNARIRAYDVQGVRCKNGRTFATMEIGVPDGLRVDNHGNVWTSAGDGVHVYSAAGVKLGTIPISETVANLCFGGGDGQTVFIAASTSIYSIRTATTDVNLATPGEM